MGYHMLEDRVRVSESFMYQLMRNYYEDRGLEAWGNGNERRADIVPFYITSNPRIAFAYGKVYNPAMINRTRSHSHFHDRTYPCPNHPYHTVSSRRVRALGTSSYGLNGWTGCRHDTHDSRVSRALDEKRICVVMVKRNEKRRVSY